MDEEWEDEVAGQNVNFIPCVKWVKRGVAKSQPEKVRTDQASCYLTNYLLFYLALFIG